MGEPMRSEALKITRKIIELEDKITALRSEIAMLEREFDVVIDRKSDFRQGVYFSGSLPWSEDSFSQSIAQKVKSYFTNNPDREVSIDLLHSFIPEAQPDTLRATVSRLANKDKLIKNIDRGVYKYLSDDELSFLK